MFEITPTPTTAFPIHTFIGPVAPPKGTTRGQYAHHLNETCSLTDHVYKGTVIVVASKEEIPSAEQLVDDYRPSIEVHVNRRVAFFFQQAVVCYRTKLHFEERGALDQAESAVALKANCKGEISVVSKRNAAHSSTIPCLIAYDGAAWDRHQQDEEEEEPQGFVYLKLSDYYRLANATIDVPRAINEADREIDEKSARSLLRTRSLALLNLVAQGTLTPQEALQQFVLIAQEEVANAIERTEGAVQKVLQYYAQDLRDIQEGIEEDSQVFDQLLNVQIGPHDKSEEARQVIYQIRYKAILKAQRAQAALLAKVEALRCEVLRKVKGKDKRNPVYFEDAFRTVVIECGRTNENRVRLLKLFNFPPRGPELRLSASRLTQLHATTTKVKTQAARIKFVVQEICNDMRTLRTEECYTRASVTRTLRGLRSWRQVDLAHKIKRLYPHQPSSQPTISRTEHPLGRNGKLIDAAYAEKLSAVFGVDPGLFMPHFFYE